MLKAFGANVRSRNRREEIRGQHNRSRRQGQRLHRCERSKVIRHPEVAAKRPSKDAAEVFGAVVLRGSLRSHLRITGNELVSA